MKYNYVKKALVLLLAATLALAPAGCSSASAKDNAGTASTEPSKENTGKEEPAPLLDVTEDGGCIATFDKTDKGTGGGTGITIGDGEYLVIDTALTAGQVQVRVVSGGSDMEKVPVPDNSQPATIDYVFEGSGTTEYMEIQPGNYMVNVMVEKKASGTILFSIKSKDAASEKAADAASAAASDTAAAAETAAAAGTAAEAARATATSPDMYFGSWVNGDYLLNIGESEDGMYASVHLQPKDGPIVEWLYNEVLFDEVANEMNTFETGIKTTYTFDAKGLIDTVEEEFDDGAAAFRLTKDGRMIWVDYKETPGKNEITFKKSPKLIPTPSVLE